MDAEADVLRLCNFVNQENETITVAFDENVQRVEAFDSWLVTRANWVDAELPANQR